jgi:ligand-binding sensor domain-containing protein
LWTAVALAIGVSGPAWAQYRIDSWTTEHGLPQNSVTDVLQTRDGFLWLTTFGGLVRFDGATLQVHNTVNTEGVMGKGVALQFRQNAQVVTVEFAHQSVLGCNYCGGLSIQG